MSQNLNSFTVPSSALFSHLLKGAKTKQSKNSNKSKAGEFTQMVPVPFGGQVPSLYFFPSNLFFILDLLRDASLVSGIHSSLDQVLSSHDNHHVIGVVSIKPWNLTLWIECLFRPKLRLGVFCSLETRSLCRLVWASNSQYHCPSLTISGIIDKCHHAWFSPRWNLTGRWDHVEGDLHSGILLHGELACLHKSLIRNVSLGTYVFPWKLQMSCSIDYRELLI